MCRPRKRPAEMHPGARPSGEHLGEERALSANAPGVRMRIPGASKHSREELVNPLRQSPAGTPWPIAPSRPDASWLKVYPISSPTSGT